jgi:hypothetical protein
MLIATLENAMNTPDARKKLPTGATPARADESRDFRRTRAASDTTSVAGGEPRRRRGRAEPR